MAVSLVPFSSLTAVPMKSAGASLPHVARLTGGTSGEDKTAAKIKTRTVTMPVAMTASFTMS